MVNLLKAGCTIALDNAAVGAGLLTFFAANIRQFHRGADVRVAKPEELLGRVQISPELAAQAADLLGIDFQQLVGQHDARLHAVQQGLNAMLHEIVQNVAELPGRTSPEEWPEAMLVTGDELRRIVAAAVENAMATVAV